MNHESSSRVISVETQLLADRPEAVPAVARWWFDEWGHVRPEMTLEQHIEEIRSSMSRDQVPVHVLALVDGEPVGVAMLKDHEMEYRYPDWQFWLGNVYVAAEWRGNGVAEQLALRVIEIAEQRGVPALHLQTKKLDGGVYARLGWQPVEQVDHRGNQVCVMIRSTQPGTS